MPRGTQVQTDEMTKAEAVAACKSIKQGLTSLRHKILEFHDRKGWAALGYSTWKECVQAEFGESYRRVDHQLQAARIESDIRKRQHNDSFGNTDRNGTMVPFPCNSAYESEPIPERQLRPLSKVDPDQRADVWQEVTETAPNGKITASHVEKVVAKYLETAQPDQDEPADDDDVPFGPASTETSDEGAENAKSTDPPTGMTLVEGVLMPDPPEIAELRRKGRIPPGQIPVWETVGDVDLTPEDFEPLKDAADELSDQDWVEELPLYRQLEGKQRKGFVRSAIRYRTGLLHIRALQRITEGQRQPANPTLYERRWRWFLTTNDPAHWKKCPPGDEGGCGGRGELPAIGECPTCRGGGFVLG